MTFRLSQSVVCGEIRNTTKNSVYGWIRLKGIEHPLHLELTGNCAPDLAGWHVRFEVRDSHDALPKDLLFEQKDDPDLSELHSHQIGPIGTMTTRCIRSFDCPADEFLQRREQHEPASEWKSSLYLEWYSQNGRMVVELANPRIEYVEREALDGVPMSDPSDARPIEREPPLLPPFFDETPILFDDDRLLEISEESFQDFCVDEENESPDDLYGLFSSDLQLQLDRESEALDYFLDHGEEVPTTLYETELMDDLIENSPGVPIRELLNKPDPLPDPDGLSDAAIETALKTALMRMARFGVTMNICEHFTPRDTYQLLVGDFGSDETFFPELQGTGWVQGYGTEEYCHQCEAELEEEYEETQRCLEEPPEDLPFDQPFRDDEDLPL